MDVDGGVHFVGIGGIGMSALARLLLARGCRVTGSSDRRTTLTDRLAAEGATVFIGHDPQHVGSARTVVITTAVAADNTEVVEAHRLGRAVLRRGALLAALMHERRGIAIAGTHGKTTTTAMTACVLEGGGLDPAVVVGGERVDTGNNARDGAGRWFLTEADESDGSFLDLRPEIAVVTNIENDHVSDDAGVGQLLRAFEQFATNVPASGLVLFGCDDPRAASLARAPRAARGRTFGFAPGADVRATSVTYDGFSSRFMVAAGNETLGEIALSVPGAINVLDALPAVAIGRELGVPFETIAAALAAYRGVRRRFEILARTPRMTVVDDYAHHPTAVAATIAAARAAFSGPLVVAFQPHRYTRTKYLALEFARALRGADRVVLADVYASSEDPIAGVDARSIGEPLAHAGTNVDYAGPSDALPAHVLAHAPYGALVLMLGAGSITTAAEALAECLR